MDLLGSAVSAEPLLILLVAGLIALGAVGLGFAWLATARTIENKPTARIRSAPQGYVELQGISVLLPGEPVVSPLTGTRCCWYRCRVERRESVHRGRSASTRWATVDASTSEALFAIDDGTGICCVDPDGATVIPGLRRVWYGNLRRPVVAPQAGSGLFRAMFSRYRYTEELLLPGRPIYAIGLLRTIGGHGAAPNAADRARELLARWKRDPAMRAQLDLDGDGQIDMQEWEAARQRALAEAQAAAVAEDGPLPDSHLLTRPADRRPFVLSALTQEQLVRRYRVRGVIAILVGILLLGVFGALTHGQL